MYMCVREVLWAGLAARQGRLVVTMDTHDGLVCRQRQRKRPNSCSGSIAALSLSPLPPQPPLALSLSRSLALSLCIPLGITLPFFIPPPCLKLNHPTSKVVCAMGAGLGLTGGLDCC